MNKIAQWLLVFFTAIIATFTVLDFFNIGTVSTVGDMPNYEKEIKEINKTVWSIKALLNSIDEEVRIHITDDLYLLLDNSNSLKKRYTDWTALYLNANSDKLKGYVYSISK